MQLINNSGTRRSHHHTLTSQPAAGRLAADCPLKDAELLTLPLQVLSKLKTEDGKRQGQLDSRNK